MGEAVQLVVGALRIGAAEDRVHLAGAGHDVVHLDRVLAAQERALDLEPEPLAVDAQADRVEDALLLEDPDRAVDVPDDALLGDAATGSSQVAGDVGAAL